MNQPKTRKTMDQAFRWRYVEISIKYSAGLWSKVPPTLTPRIVTTGVAAYGVNSRGGGSAIVLDLRNWYCCRLAREWIRRLLIDFIVHMSNSLKFPRTVYRIQILVLLTLKTRGNVRYCKDEKSDHKVAYYNMIGPLDQSSELHFRAKMF